jgi:hypothetical protein
MQLKTSARIGGFDHKLLTTVTNHTVKLSRTTNWTQKIRFENPISGFQTSTVLLSASLVTQFGSTSHTGTSFLVDVVTNHSSIKVKHILPFPLNQSIVFNSNNY